MAATEMIEGEVEFVRLTLGLAGAGGEGVAGERRDRTQLTLWSDSLLLLSPGKHTQSPHVLLSGGGREGDVYLLQNQTLTTSLSR